MTLKTFEELPNEEQGALLLAHLRGVPLQTWDSIAKCWHHLDEGPSGWDGLIIRIKPHPQTVTMYGRVIAEYGGVFETMRDERDTHKITLTIDEDGEIEPTAKVERI